MCAMMIVCECHANDFLGEGEIDNGGGGVVGGAKTNKRSFPER